MVLVRRKKGGFTLRRRDQFDREKLGMVAAGLSVGFFLAILYSSIQDERELPAALIHKRKHSHVGEMLNGDLPDKYNAIAEDINALLSCESLLNVTKASANGNGNDWNHRRLEGAGGIDFGDDATGSEAGNGGGMRGAWSDNNADNNGNNNMNNNNNNNGNNPDGGGGAAFTDDFNGFGENGDNGAYDDWMDIDARHVFCVAASSSPSPRVISNMKCDASGSRREPILDLWSAARAEIDKENLLTFLELFREQQEQFVLDDTYHLWAPLGDTGIQYAMNVLNARKTADDGGIQGLTDVLGHGKLFADVGSCHGLTSMAISKLYPGTKIVSIEPAQPSWLMQQLNLRCNLEHDEFKKIHTVLGGVGHNNEDESSLMAKMMWDPRSTTTTRSWTPDYEVKESHIELIVKLRQLKVLLAEANIFGEAIDVLNLTCEGCEYNLIPQLSEQEFEAIPTVIGMVHWGYIPTKKLPSSARAEKTHKRLCQHENFAKISKECCAFPELPVKSVSPQEVLKRDGDGLMQPATVSDIAGNLCNDFKTWSEEKFLFDVKDDWGWFELTSKA